MNLEALFNAVIVKPIEHGIAVSVGPGQHTHLGHFIESFIKVGDEVVLPTQGFTKVEHNGEEYYVGPENSILARVKSTVEDALAETEVTPEEIKAINDLKLEDNE